MNSCACFAVFTVSAKCVPVRQHLTSTMAYMNASTSAARLNMGVVMLMTVIDDAIEVMHVTKERTFCGINESSTSTSCTF